MTHTFDLQLFAEGAESAGAPTQGELSPQATEEGKERGQCPSASQRPTPPVIGEDTPVTHQAAAKGEDTASAHGLAQNSDPSAEPTPQLQTPSSPISAHLDRLLAEAEELKRTVPDFDLWRELDNSDFARLTNPTSRVSLRAAYYAVHHEEINRRNMRAAAEAAAAETAKRLTGAYLSAQRRPQENGSASSAASVETVDWHTASREQLIAQRRAILTAAARGETIYPKYR